MRPPPAQKPRKKRKPKGSAIGVPRPEMIIGKPVEYKPKKRKPFTPALQEELLERLSSGESMANICREEYMPHRVTVWEAGQKDPVFGARLKIAQKHQAAAMMDQGLAILDAATPETAYLAKNQFDARRIYASKLDRENFGDERTTKIVGDPERPLAVTAAPLEERRLQAFRQFMRETGFQLPPPMKTIEYQPAPEPAKPTMSQDQWDEYVRRISQG